MVKISRIELDNKGLTKFFSPNEARIMEIIWKNKVITSSQIQKECPGLSLSCVAGTLDRLVKSGIVKREIDTSQKKIRYIYHAKTTKEEFGEQISERIFESLYETFGEVVTNSFGKFREKR